MAIDFKTDTCCRCDNIAMATTPNGRMCGGHALVEAAREWNQGNWSWAATFDPGILSPPDQGPAVLSA